MDIDEILTALAALMENEAFKLECCKEDPSEFQQGQVSGLRIASAALSATAIVVRKKGGGNTNA